MAESSGLKGNLVWNCFTKTTDNKAKCNTCGKELAFTSGSTNTLKSNKTQTQYFFFICMSFYHYSKYKLHVEKKLKLGTFDIRKG
jgi:hypothetical protein